MSSPELKLGTGERVVLGRKVASGGEGTVYEVQSQPDVAVKLYHQPPNGEQVDKLAAMFGMGSAGFSELAAWPTSPALDAVSGQLLGFTMPFVLGYVELHRLYNPQDRKSSFGTVDWRFLILAARNMASAFSCLHKSGVVIGDVNHSSVLVDRSGDVRLIDCDSFQIRSGERVFRCEVAEQFHSPPELYKADLKQIVRTPNHDSFGLAVLIFELLFMGRHPFAGSYFGDGSPSLVEKISDFRFAYGSSAAEKLVEAPASSLRLDAVGPLAPLFERAFTEGGIEERPSAEEWIDALDELSSQLISCRVGKSHVYFRDLPGCPWCAIEATSGVILFEPDIHSGRYTFDLAGIWEEILLVQAPEEVPTPDFEAWPRVRAREAVRQKVAIRRSKWAVVVAPYVASCFLLFSFVRIAALDIFVALAVFGLGVFGAWIWLTRDAFFADSSVVGLQNELWSLRHEWSQKADASRFTHKLQSLADARKQYESLDAHRAHRREVLESSREVRERQQHMESYRIAQHKIDGVNLSRCVRLAEHGVVSAADISEKSLSHVPEIGPALRATLIAWRKSVASQYQFDSEAGVSTHDLIELDREIETERRNLESQLENGATELRHLKAEILDARQRILAQLPDLLARFGQAGADRNALGRP